MFLYFLFQRQTAIVVQLKLSKDILSICCLEQIKSVMLREDPFVNCKNRSGFKIFWAIRRFSNS